MHLLCKILHEGIRYFEKCSIQSYYLPNIIFILIYLFYLFNSFAPCAGTARYFEKCLNITLNFNRQQFMPVSGKTSRFVRLIHLPGLFYACSSKKSVSRPHFVLIRSTVSMSIVRRLVLPDSGTRVLICRKSRGTKSENSTPTFL